MKYRPMFFNIMAFTFAALALNMPLQISYIYNYSLLDFQNILSKMTSINWLLFTLFITNAVLSVVVHKALLYTLPMLAFVTMVNNWMVSQYGQDFNFSETSLATLAVIAMVAAYYRPEIYKCISDPNFRWWRCHKRYKKSVPLDITHDGHLIRGLSFDISQTGMFIQEDHLLNISQLKIGDEINLKIKLPFGSIDCTAQIVRKVQAKGEYPAGIGVQFTQVPTQFDHFVDSYLDHSAGSRLAH